MTVTLRKGPLLTTDVYRDTKDPCPVFDGKKWHIYGSGGSSLIEKWKILHATADSIEGPWKLEEPARIGINKPHVAAPGVIFDDDEKIFHMFVQTEFLDVGGSIIHLVSKEGDKFGRVGRILKGVRNSNEATIYDPHPAIINGEKYLTYSAGPVVGRPDIFLLKSKSNTWYGPWVKRGPILKHEEVPHHNQHDHDDYEWGLEGSQLIQLSNGKVLLNAVCFLPEGKRGTRQRVFFSVAKDVNGPYKSLGPILDPSLDMWGQGENGHAAGFVRNDKLNLFYQAREGFADAPWKYGHAIIDVF